VSGPGMVRMGAAKEARQGRQRSGAVRSDETRSGTIRHGRAGSVRNGWSGHVTLWQVGNMTKTEIMHIAAKASCDPRTVKRFIEGKAVRELVAERIRAAMKDLGLKRG